jgi:hypothetical protein
MSINSRKTDGSIDSTGNAQRRENLSGEAVAGSPSGVGGSTPRTFEERAKYREAVARRNLKG